ncbi:MAG: menaquinone biosynthesis protein [Planctomycetaceae bacterium]|nr:menaquinone biosynthesis protein [Planctomycetaceae bacterium]
MTLRIGTVPYSNAFPLIHFLPEYLPGAVISEWIPSAMRQQLAEQHLDLALMPVAELPHLPEGRIVSNCCIACDGPVQSVLVFSRVPIEQIRSISLDSASRSSVMICEMLFRQFYGIQPETHCLESDQNPDFCGRDAFLLIGDRALAYRPTAAWPYRYDVGELWKAKTGLPLVFAAWIGCTPQVFDESLALALERARDRGLQELETILDAKERQGIALPLGRERMLDYYRQSIIYKMPSAY